MCQLIAVRQKRWAAPGLRGTSLQRAGPFGPKTELVLGQPSHVGHRSHARLGWPSEIWDILPQGGMIRTWDDPVESKVGQPYQTPRETGAHEVTQPLTGTPVGRLTPAAAASPCRSRVAARGGRARRVGVGL